MPSASKDLTVGQQQFLIKAQEENALSAAQHKSLIGGLVQEMKAYEAANINSHMVDRMEKICVSSLAQKDQIIMA